MSFRDDRDALAARLRALERDLADAQRTLGDGRPSRARAERGARVQATALLASPTGMRLRTLAGLAAATLALTAALPPDGARAQRLPGVLVEVSTRGGADVRPVGTYPWTVQLVIRDDGSWSADGRTGQLTDAQRRLVQRLAARARLVFVRPTGPMCAAVPDAAYRLRTGRGSVIWASPCAAGPHRSVAALLEQVRAFTSAPASTP